MCLYRPCLFVGQSVLFSSYYTQPCSLTQTGQSLLGKYLKSKQLWLHKASWVVWLHLSFGGGVYESACVCVDERSSCWNESGRCWRQHLSALETWWSKCPGRAGHRLPLLSNHRVDDELKESHASKCCLFQQWSPLCMCVARLPTNIELQSFWLQQFKGIFRVQYKLSSIDSICGTMLITTENNFDF